jgi:regulator of protease activity HflC (stomatin/prohibitin superfamily)
MASAPMMNERTVMLQRKVEAARAERLSICEWVCTALGCLTTLPFLGLTGLRVVPPMTRLAIFRFGKLVTTIRSPGLTWAVPCGTFIQSFAGSQTHKLEELNVVDASGNPIVVRCVLEFAVEDPEALQIAANGSLYVLFNMAEQVVREACSHLPLVGERGADIRSQTHELATAMATDLQPDASVLGVTVLRLVIVEAHFAAEIAGAMLAKQGAAAMVAARKEIVAGALLIVRDTLAEFPQLGDASRDRLISNLLVSLTSHAPATPVLPISA